MYVPQMWGTKGQHLLPFSVAFYFIYFWDKVFHWTWNSWFSKTGQLMISQDPPVSVLFQCWNFRLILPHLDFIWMLEIQAQVLFCPHFTPEQCIWLISNNSWRLCVCVWGGALGKVSSPFVLIETLLQLASDLDGICFQSPLLCQVKPHVRSSQLSSALWTSAFQCVLQWVSSLVCSSRIMLITCSNNPPALASAVGASCL